MKKILSLLALSALSACGTQKSADCPNVMCTQEFRFVTVQLISGSGKEVSFKKYEVKNDRTGKNVNSNPSPNSAATPNTLVVADDSNLKNLSAKGDKLTLTVYREDGSTMVTPFIISGGACNCHVSKVSGPDQLDIDKK
ncbi:MAG: hypothetical protein INR69_23510 [Mucilaginibacter polytrichastri]|nr:hypothetical protein [Mucilaginibacter polytrichastri]